MSGLKFLNIFLSLTHQHNKKTSLVQQQGLKKNVFSFNSKTSGFFFFLFFGIIFLSLLFYRIL